MSEQRTTEQTPPGPLATAVSGGGAGVVWEPSLVFGQHIAIGDQTALLPAPPYPSLPGSRTPTGQYPPGFVCARLGLPPLGSRGKAIRIDRTPMSITNLREGRL